MADLPPGPDAGDAASAGPDRGSTSIYPGTPRWVKAFGLVVIVLVLLVVVVMVAGVGGHGPGRHVPSGGAGGHVPPAAHGVQQPWR
jgi:hypothetical protein